MLLFPFPSFGSFRLYLKLYACGRTWTCATWRVRSGVTRVRVAHCSLAVWLRGGMGLVNRHFCVPTMRATPAVILAMGSPLAGGTLQMAGWRLFGSCLISWASSLPLASSPRQGPEAQCGGRTMCPVCGEHDERSKVRASGRHRAYVSGVYQRVKKHPLLIHS